MDDVYKNINGYNPIIRRKSLMAFDDMIAEIMSNEKFQAFVKKLFLRCRKLNISYVFIIQSYFSVPKDVRLKSTCYLIMKINNETELQNITINHSPTIDYNDFMKIHRECTKELYSFYTIHTASPAIDFLRLKKKKLCHFYETGSS